MKKLLIAAHLEPLLTRDKSVLSRSAFIVLTAPSNDELLSLHKKERGAIIVTELDMAGMSGDILCSAIRSDTALTKAMILLVCNNVPSDIRRVSQCAANAYIAKPVHPRKFLDKIVELLSIDERKDYRVLLQVKVHGDRQSRAFLCSSQDLSVSGILIETDKHLEKGDMLTCSFFIPLSGQITVEGQVMRVVSKSGGTLLYGVRFVNLNLRYKHMIEGFISRNRTSQSAL